MPGEHSGLDFDGGVVGEDVLEPAAWPVSEGEAVALRREDVLLPEGVLRVRAALSERSTGELVLGPPKSRAGIRAVTLPQPVAAAVSEHLEQYVGMAPNSFVFTGDMGGALRRSNFNRRVRWAEAVARVGAPGLHFHDLRHTGNTLAAGSGASLRDLMVRMGHDSLRAALIYQHASSHADVKIAEELARRIEASVVDGPETGCGVPGPLDQAG